MEMINEEKFLKCHIKGLFISKEGYTGDKSLKMVQRIANES